MKKWSICIFLSFLFCISITSLHAQEAFVIDDADIQLMVHEDGSIDITERYDLDFQQYRHGFYRNIPTQYQMRWNHNGTTKDKSYYFPISNVTCSTRCEIDASAKGVSVKLGDPNKQVIGKQTYQISYHVKTKDLGLDGEQMLYWNLIGEFDTKIKHVSYQITMPKAFDKRNVDVNYGLYGKQDEVKPMILDNVIKGEIQNTLFNNEQATIMVRLDNQYFTFPPQADYGWFLLGISVILMIIGGILFLCFGKDDDIIITVEFTAPKGLDSASVGYIIDHQVNNRDIISLIIYWANEGYLKIHDQKDGFQLEKLKDMEADRKGYERTFFQALFNDKDIVNDKDLKNEKMGKALTSAKQQLHNYFMSPKRKIYTSSSIVLQFFMILLIAIPQAVCTFLTAYAKFEWFTICIPYLIPSLILLIGNLPWIFLMRKHHVLKRSTMTTLVILLIVLNSIMIAVNAMLQLMLGASVIAIIVCAIATAALTLFMVFMDKRTKQGTLWIGQILGLKEFILTCEKERLELLVQENPYAFFEILPYAYVLGISDTWVKKFETIAMTYPDWYEGYDQGNVFMSMIWWHHFHYCFHNITQAVTYVPPVESGSGGGNIGSFGGGGFSGGGFGGGGGGSW